MKQMWHDLPLSGSLLLSSTHPRSSGSARHARSRSSLPTCCAVQTRIIRARKRGVCWRRSVCAERAPARVRDTHTNHTSLSCLWKGASRRGSISDENEIALLAADAACRCDSVHGRHDLISQPPAFIPFILSHALF